jgi:predicted Zn-dependent protease
MVFMVRGTIAGLVTLFLCGCYTVPGTGRRALNMMPDSQMSEMGLTAFQEMKQELKVSTDARANALVTAVGRKIAAVAPLPDAQWEFVVFEVDEPNAFCLPGGKVGVYTGILPITQTEEGLATVIGHEVAHAVAKHGNERVSRAAVSQQVGSVLGALTSESKFSALISQAYGLGGQVLVDLPHSRAQESEADYLGLLYMAEAGYNPEAAVAFWQRFADYNAKAGGSTPWFLRTHPLDSQRVKQLRQWLPEAKQIYERNRQSGGGSTRGEVRKK